MKKSIKQTLQELIRKEGYLSYSDLQTWCDGRPCKIATAERKLRPSDSPMIEAVYKGSHIIGYKPAQTQFIKDLEKLKHKHKCNTQNSTPNSQSQLSL